MRKTILNLAAAAAVFVVSGCEAMEGLFVNAPPPASTDVPAGEVTRPPAEQTAAVPSPPRPGIKPARPAVPAAIGSVPDPKALIGKNQSEAEAVLGPPNAVQNAPPATIWQYRADGCTLNVFFYMDIGTNSLKALAYDAELANTAANDDTIARCMQLVQVTNRAGRR